MNDSNELLEVTRELQALYYRRDAEQRGVQLHAARLHQIREAIKVAEARREGLALEALAATGRGQIPDVRRD